MAGRKVFALFGVIGLEGAEGVFKNLNAIDKKAKDLSRQLNKTGNQLNRLGKDLTKAFTAPMIAAGAAVGVLTTKIGTYADHLLDLEQITGLSTDKLQEFENVSRVAGVSFDGLVGIITKFTNQLPEIEKGGNAASVAFKKLNVSIRDGNGNVRSMNDLFPEIISALQSMENVTERNALAQDVFGRSLTDIAPVLGLTKDQLHGAMQEAHDLGIVMSRDALNAANDYRIEIEKLKGQFTAVIREIGMGFIPVITGTLIPLIKSQAIPAIKNFADGIKKALEWFTSLPKSVQESAVKMAIFTAAVGPALIAIGSLLKSIAGLRSTILLLNAVMIGTPFGLIAAAAVTLGVAIYNLKKNYDDLKKAHTSTIKVMTAEKAKQDELVSGYKSLLDIATKNSELIKDESERNKLLGKETERLTGIARDLGYVVEGNNDEKLQSLNLISQEIQGVRDATGALIRYSTSQKQVATNTKEITKLTKEQIEEMAEYEEKVQSKLNDLVKSRMNKVREQKEKDLDLEVQNNFDMLDQYREYAKEIESIDVEISRARQELADMDKAREEEVKNLKINAGFQAFNILSQLNTNSDIAEDNRYKKEQERIENSLMTEEQKEAALKKIDSEHEKRKSAIRKRQAILDKAAALFDIAINTAVAVVKALPNVVLASIIGGLGAAQGIAVAAQPIPAAEKGAYLPGTSDGTIIRAGEKKKPEIIFPLTTGIDILAGSLVDKLKALVAPMAPQMQVAGGGNIYVDVNVNGNFIGNNAAMRDLAKEIGVEIKRGITREGARG